MLWQPSDERRSILVRDVLVLRRLAVAAVRNALNR
jgi:hypothetical protein